MKKARKLLTLDDLYDFYFKQNKNCTFSSKESGYQVSVQIPSRFEIAKREDDGTLLFCKVKLMHSGVNRNHSCVTDDALKRASENLAYKPILANFMEYTDKTTGEVLKDFTSHDMTINDDGFIDYIEKQIGCFTADEPFFEIEKETNHNFLYGYCAIPVQYTDACSIIERKGGTKVSVELSVNEMEYKVKDRVLELTDVTITGACCLGRNPETNEEIGEGMENARLDIVDFSTENNSLFTDYNSAIIEMQDRLTKLESVCFNINDDSKKGGNQVEIETKEKDIIVNAEEPEEETKEDEIIDDPEETADTTDETDDEETDTDDESEDSEGSDSDKDFSITYSNIKTGSSRTFVISLNDKVRALCDIVNAQYAESDNTYYCVIVYDNYVIMNDVWNGKYFKQTYTEDNGEFTLTGDREKVFVEYVTEEELNELDAMRNDYPALVKFKADKEKEELHGKKEELLSDAKYSVLEKNEKFKELIKNMDNYSLAELEKEAKVIFADHVAEIGVFSLNKDGDASSSIKLFGNPNTKKTKSSRYGDLFKR